MWRMMLLVAALTSSVAHAAEQKLLVLDVRSVDLDKEQTGALTSFITARAGRFASLDVVSAAELRDLAELQAEKMEAGCDEEASACIAELAGALDAELVLLSRAGKLEGNYVVTASLFDAKTGTAKGRASVQAWSLDDIPAKLGPALDDVLAQATGATPQEDEKVEHVEQEGLDPVVVNAARIGGGVGAVVGVGLFTLGAIPGFVYNQKKSDLIEATAEFTGEQAQIDEAQRIHREGLEAKELYNNAGQWAVLSGTVLVVVGVGAVVGSFFVPVVNE